MRNIRGFTVRNIGGFTMIRGGFTMRSKRDFTMRNIGKRFISVALCLLLAAPVFAPAVAYAADPPGDAIPDVVNIIWKGVTITSNSTWYDAGYPTYNRPENLLDAVGLSAYPPSYIEAALFAEFNDPDATTYCWHTANLADSPGLHPTLEIDLQTVEDVESLYIWNSNRHGLSSRCIKDVTIEYSEDRINWYFIPGDSSGDANHLTIPRNEVSYGNPAPYDIKIDFDVQARYVRITAYGSYGDWNYWALGKLIFTRSQLIVAEDIIVPATVVAGSSWGAHNPNNLINSEGIYPPNPAIVNDITYTNNNTWTWHTDNDNKENAWLRVDLGREEKVEELYIWNLHQDWGALPGRDAKTVNVYYSDSADGVLTAVNSFPLEIPQATAGVYSNGYQIKVDFNGVSTRFVTIKILDSYGDPDYWGLGKLIFTRTPQTPAEKAKLALREAVAAAQTLVESDYTKSSWAGFISVLNQVKDVPDDTAATLEDFNTALSRLTYSINSLIALPKYDSFISPVAIVAGSSWPDTAVVRPEFLIDDYGLNPSNPTSAEGLLYSNKYGDAALVWHTNSDDKSNAWVRVDFGWVEKLDTLYIWNLSQYSTLDLTSRDAREIRISFSSNSVDGEDGDWTVMGEYTLDSPRPQGAPAPYQLAVDFAGAEARFVRIQILSSYGDPNYWGLGKLIFSRMEKPSDADIAAREKLSLQRVVDDAAAVYEILNSHEVFTGASFIAYQAAIDEANRLLSDDNSTMEDVLDARYVLTAAIEQLEDADPGSWITPVPSNEPNTYQKRQAYSEYGMCIHYGINTFANTEWSFADLPQSVYNPNLETLDPDSWVKHAYESGMNYVVLVTSHVEGFSLWDTQVGDYDINHTGREGDKRDIVREVSDACKKYGIKLGLYYCLYNGYWELKNTGKAYYTIANDNPPEVDKRHNDYALAKIAELLDGRYGEISYLWLDATGWKTAYKWNLPRLYNLVKRLQPSCLVSCNPNINPGQPELHLSGDNIAFAPTDFRLCDPRFTRPGVNGDPKLFDDGSGQMYYQPFEATVINNATWFFSDHTSAASVRPAAQVVQEYRQMIEQGNNYQLNLSPNRDGLLLDFDVSSLFTAARELGIARGGARAGAPADECEVDVRYVTDRGYIAATTQYLYGSVGDAYSAAPLNLVDIGYELVDTPDNASGEFADNRTTVTFTYHDFAAWAELQAMIETTESRTQADYTPDSWSGFIGALANAKAIVYNDSVAVQQEACRALFAAMSALVSAVPVTDVTISGPSSPLAAGGSYQFSAVVNGSGGAPCQEVFWSVYGADKETTRIDENGLLSIAINEGSYRSDVPLKIRATSVADSTKFKEVNIYKDTGCTSTADKVTVSPDGAVAPLGGALKLSASVTGINSPNQNVTWSVDSDISYVTREGVLIVEYGETARKLTVKATSEVDGATFGTTVVRLFPAADKTGLLELIAIAEALDPDDYTVESWAVLESALSAAKVTADDDYALQNEADDAQAALLAAYEALETKKLEALYVNAFVTKINGNKNDLTITVDEIFCNGTSNTIEVTFSIDNNAAGTYTVGPYEIYVDTKGNVQIRNILVVNLDERIVVVW